MKLENTNIIHGKMNTGKTKGILFKEVDEIIRKQENILMIDMKEEYYDVFSKTLKAQGYNITVINIKEPLKSNNYNPFTMAFNYYKYKNIDKCIELLEKIVLSICYIENQEDPFWTNSAKDLFIGLSLIIFKEAKEEEINLGSVSTLLAQLETKKFKKYFDNLEVTDPIYVVAATIQNYPTDTRGSIISVLKQKLNKYMVRPNLLSLLSTTSFDINNFGTKKEALFVIMKDDDKELNNIANMLIDQIVYKIKENNTKINLVLDNIDFINRVSCINSLLNINYPNIKTTLISRNIDLLKDKYGREAIDNALKIINTNEKKIATEPFKTDKIDYPNLNKEYKFFDARSYFNE